MAETLFSDADVEAATQAVAKLFEDYHARRRAESQRVFGHEGAHIAGIPYPTTSIVVRTVLETVEARRVQ